MVKGSPVEPGPENLITDVPGLRVGNAANRNARTGVTVILPDRPAVMAVDVRGGGPGTRETDALAPSCLIDALHGLVLSGGSAFGLEAASAVVAHLSAQGIGLPLNPRAVPVVPSAILYDLGNGGNKDWGEDPPYRRLGRDACRDAGAPLTLGNVGAGYGARAGALKGGLGSASAVFGAKTGDALATLTGGVVGALVAVNCFGSVTMPESGAFWAAPFEQNGEFEGFGGLTLAPGQAAALTVDLPKIPELGTNTTLGVVATDFALTKAEAQRIAIMAQDGFARAIRPVHTPFDGDTIFVLSTGGREIVGSRPLALTELGAVAADCVARAVVRGVLAAETLGASRCYKDVFRK